MKNVTLHGEYATYVHLELSARQRSYTLRSTSTLSTSIVSHDGSRHATYALLIIVNGNYRSMPLFILWVILFSNPMADTADESFSRFPCCPSHPHLYMISVDVQYIVSNVYRQRSIRHLRVRYEWPLFARATMADSGPWYTHEFPRIFQATRTGSLRHSV